MRHSLRSTLPRLTACAVGAGLLACGSDAALLLSERLDSAQESPPLPTPTPPGDAPSSGGESAKESPPSEEVYCTLDLPSPRVLGIVTDDAGDPVLASRARIRPVGGDQYIDCETYAGRVECFPESYHACIDRQLPCLPENYDWPEGDYEILVERGEQSATVLKELRPTGPCRRYDRGPVDVTFETIRPDDACPQDVLPLLATLRTAPGEDVEGMFAVEVLGAPEGVEVLAQSIVTQERPGVHEVRIHVGSGWPENQPVSIRVQADVTGDWCYLGPADIAFGVVEAEVLPVKAADGCRFKPVVVNFDRSHLVHCGYASLPVFSAPAIEKTRTAP